jgi:hypothetical protein
VVPTQDDVLPLQEGKKAIAPAVAVAEAILDRRNWCLHQTGYHHLRLHRKKMVQPQSVPASLEVQVASLIHPIQLGVDDMDLSLDNMNLWGPRIPPIKTQPGIPGHKQTIGGGGASLPPARGIRPASGVYKARQGRACCV